MKQKDNIDIEFYVKTFIIGGNRMRLAEMQNYNYPCRRTMEILPDKIV